MRGVVPLVNLHTTQCVFCCAPNSERNFRKFGKNCLSNSRFVAIFEHFPFPHNRLFPLSSSITKSQVPCNWPGSAGHLYWKLNCTLRSPWWWSSKRECGIPQLVRFAGNVGVNAVVLLPVPIVWNTTSYVCFQQLLRNEDLLPKSKRVYLIFQKVCSAFFFLLLFFVCTNVNWVQELFFYNKIQMLSLNVSLFFWVYFSYGDMMFVCVTPLPNIYFDNTKTWENIWTISSFFLLSIKMAFTTPLLLHTTWRGLFCYPTWLDHLEQLQGIFLFWQVKFMHEFPSPFCIFT